MRETPAYSSWRRSRMRLRTPSRSPRPDSLAQSSSEREGHRRPDLLHRDVEHGLLAGELGAREVGGEGDGDLAVAGRLRPSSWSSKPGTMVLLRARAASPWRCRPRTARRRPCPRSRRAARRPPAAGRGSAGGSSSGAPWRGRPAPARPAPRRPRRPAWSAAGRPRSTSGTSGRTSRSTLNSRSLPSSNEVTSTLGRSAGRSWWSLIALREPPGRPPPRAPRP